MLPRNPKNGQPLPIHVYQSGKQVIPLPNQNSELVKYYQSGEYVDEIYHVIATMPNGQSREVVFAHVDGLLTGPVIQPSLNMQELFQYLILNLPRRALGEPDLNQFPIPGQRRHPNPPFIYVGVDDVRNPQPVVTGFEIKPNGNWRIYDYNDVLYDDVNTNTLLDFVTRLPSVTEVKVYLPNDNLFYVYYQCYQYNC